MQTDVKRRPENPRRPPETPDKPTRDGDRFIDLIVWPSFAHIIAGRFQSAWKWNEFPSLNILARQGLVFIFHVMNYHLNDFIRKQRLDGFEKLGVEFVYGLYGVALMIDKE